MARSDSWKTEPVAIVGTSCRFPGGANSPSKLWQILRDPPDLRREIPSNKFNQQSFFHPESVRHGASNVAHSYILEEDTARFDHGFFNINPKEAESMDPQQRLLLETVYEGIEAAGYAMSNLRGSSTGVFVGQMTDDYYDILNKDVQCAPQYTATGSSRAIIANRISYFFDWRGPSVNIDTACSSSLVALHQAVQSLRSGETSLAIAAGVNLILGPEKYIYESQLSMLSPTGRSRMWDQQADGYARGEGFAAVVLKPLSKALADNDQIECIIRETGVNQDGRSEGLTVPSSEAQKALIQSTYDKCGLDLREPKDRCQYFEAHGTGTQAGDPKEARAIHDAFFSRSETRVSSKDKLYVGSIKTIIGHLEGAAGLAGLLKAVLAVQYGKIPQNLHFNRLNPKIKPFYDNLEIPTKIVSWPDLASDVPRRASINSFGFGGTNAHAIIESWHPWNDGGVMNRTDTASLLRPDSYQQDLGPFTFSATSEDGLMAVLSNMSHALDSNPDINLRDLAWTLQYRREQFSVRAAIAAVDREQLIERLTAISKDASTLSAQSSKATEVSDEYPVRILGIFTGQGAQWPRMGAELYKHSVVFESAINQMQEALDDLPDAPSWSLHSELLAPTGSSRLKHAEIAQPICAAVQIGLVDLLKVAGIDFHGVVGHSSGEIAAAYAAGYLSARDAIRIAYYRGSLSHLASSPTGQSGKMMAVGLSLQDAEAFCRRPQFHDRISVAASNARSSVTISGDADAIIEAKGILDAEGIFARALQVDKAYHSKHMKPCAGAYLDALRACNIKVLRTNVSDGGCVWYSSVYGSAGRYMHEPESFTGQYWVDNLVKPVMFSQALDRAVQESQRLDLILEVGPHPALRGPASDLIKGLTGIALPYCGVLKRGENDQVAFREALGFVWRHIQVNSSCQTFPDFQAFARTCKTNERDYRPQVCKYVPNFPWNHCEPLLWESRVSKLWRGRKEPEHDLLGLPTVSGNRQEVHWRKIMRVKEMEWLRGHRFQSQVLFPAAGYVSMAVEAASYLVPDRADNTKVIELNDMQIHRAITLSEESSTGTEVTFIIHTRQQGANITSAEFSCYSVEADAGADEESHCNFTGSVTITTSAVLDAASEVKSLRPLRKELEVPLTDVNLDQFYSSVSSIGLDYSGDFQASSIKRRLGFATVSISQRDRLQYRVDPAVLDTSFHGVFSAFSYPNDGRMWTAYLPTSIHRIRITPNSLRQQKRMARKNFTAHCFLREASDKVICADVDLYSAADDTLELTLEGLTCTSFMTQSPDQDRKLFSHTVWRKDISCGIENNKTIKASHDDARLYEVLERTSYFFLRKLREKVSASEIDGMPWHYRACLSWVFDRLLPSIANGQHPRVKAEWSTDRDETVQSWRSEFRNDISLRAVHAIGEAYSDIVRGYVPPLQILMEDNVLDRLYKDCIGAQTANTQVGEFLGQLAHRYPHMNVLEIGAGTGGTTKTALKFLGSNFTSYTYTDISPGFFEKAASAFSNQVHKMIFQTLNIENDPVNQGFQEHSFDVILAANVLHATTHLETTIANCRKLLRPGGRMILLEITSEALWIQAIFSMLPGWWLGQAEGRINHPTVSIDDWDDLLRRQGFSGVDAQCRDLEEEDLYTFSVFTTQAVDDRILALRNPLRLESGSTFARKIEHLIIISHESSTTDLDLLVSHIEELLAPFASDITVARGLKDPVLSPQHLPLGSVVISLVDIHEASFHQMDSIKFQSLKSIFNNCKTILWTTRGCCADDPFANIIVGLGRSLMQELTHLNLQFVDLDTTKTNRSAKLLSNMLLRMLYTDSPSFKDIVWSSETETRVQDGHTYIPRIVPEEASNQRLNSGRRTVQNQVDLLRATDRPITLRRDSHNGQFCIEQAFNALQGCANGLSNLIQVRVHTCSLYPLITNEGRHCFICTGKTVESQEAVIALAPTNSSSIWISSDHLITLGPDQRSTLRQQQLLRAALIRVVCEGLVKDLTSIQGTVWLHAADSYVAAIVSEVTIAHGLDLFWTSSSSVRVDDSDSLSPRFVHSLVADRTLRAQLPNQIRCLLTLGEEPVAGFYQRLVSCLDISTKVCHLTSQTSFHGHLAVALSVGELCESFQDTVKSLMTESSVGAGRCPAAIPIDNLPTNRASTPYQFGPLDLVEWECAEHVVAVVKPLDISTMFSNDKTYFLVGLTGELGLGLCNWMIDNGARHLALSSRKPDIDLSILDSWKRKGANVQVFSLDVTDEAMLHDVHQQIVKSMPPIGGVMNGAMVLNDKPFSAMTLDDFDAVIGPKARGSEYLDRIFRSDPLDFFILFSSLSRVIGNPGQSNYAAANMFMASLASQRRARGVAASVIDIAMLVGFGWMWRNAGEILEAQMKAAAYMSISEPEFHTIIAEAIEAGRPDSGLDPEIHTGLAMSNTASWKRFPRFSHFVPSETQSLTTKDMAAKADKTLRQLILEATSNEDVLNVLETAFSRKLCSVLQLASTSSSLDPKMALLSLGIDSLVAVELRSWFLKELAVDVPTLRILGGATIADISIEVKTKLKLPSKLKSAAVEIAPDVKKDTSALLGGSDTVVPTLQVDKSSFSTFPEGSRDDQLHNKTRLDDRSTLDTVPSPSFAASSSSTATPGRSTTPVSSITTQPDSYERTGPMSHSQEAIHFLHEYLADMSSQNVLFHGRYPHRLNLPHLGDALQHIARRHEALRSAYFVDPISQKAVQAVRVDSGIHLMQKRIESESDVDTEVQQLRRHVFDISAGKLMIVAVLSISDDLHHIVIAHHHIAMDAHASIIFLSELTKTYAKEPLSNSPPQAIDLCSISRAECEPAKIADKLSYWRNIHKDALDPVPLFPFSRTGSRKPLHEYDVQTFDLKIDADTCALIRRTSSQLHVTPFHFYIASLQALLARCLNTTEDMNIGIVDSNRGTYAEEAQALGCFLNLLPLRLQLQQDESFDTIVRRTRDTVLAALANAGVPFEVLLDQLRVPRHSTHHPLFQVIINYRLGVPSHSPLGDGKIEWTGAMAARNSYDLGVEVSDTPRGACILSFTTQRYMYSAVDTKRLMDWYVHILKSFAYDVSGPVRACALASPDDMHKAAMLGHGPTVPIAWEATLIDEIERIATRFPDSIAIKDDDGGQASYSAMIRSVEQICRGLQAREMEPGIRVAVLLNPNINSVCTLLAVLRRGLVWVPLDVRNHQQRLASIISDCHPSHIIYSDATKSLAQELCAAAREENQDVKPVCLGELVEPTISSESDLMPNLSQRDADAVILYTSGSTGVPKGVRLTHMGLLNQIYVLADIVGKAPVVLQQTSHGFDMALDQIFNALARGGTLIVVGQSGRGDPKHISNVMLSEGVTYTCFVPSEYHMLLQFGAHDLKQCHQWEFAHAGGEKVTRHLCQAFRDLALPNLKLFNAYGPTETYLSCARGLIPYQTDADDTNDMDHMQILPNYNLFIVDEKLKPVPTGFPGEICICSRYSISPGYNKRPQENEHSFMDSNLFQEELTQMPAYRTGDLGRMSDDRTLTVLGRIGSQASQVKIRGQRVELEEIAAVVVRCSNNIISNAAVSWRSDAEILAVLIVLSSDVNEDSIKWVKHELREKLPLPPYMRPTVWIPVAGIPINSNGKADRRAIDQYPIPDLDLPGLEGLGSDEQFLVPLSQRESEIAEIWKQVLVGKSCKILDSESEFFSMGGNSRNLIELRFLLEKQFAPAKVRLPELFQHSSLGEMAAMFPITRDYSNEKALSHVSPQLDWGKEIADVCSEVLNPRSTRGGVSLMQSGSTGSTDPRSLVVVLTGATGFLGDSIAQRLVDDARVGEVHCIAVRDTTGLVNRVPVKSNKIFEYAGDLELPLLGLSETDFESLSKHANVIIHNGAQVSFLKTYHSLRKSNISSTIELCRMALVGQTPLHFVSSASVALVPALSPSEHDKIPLPLALPERSASDRVPDPGSQSGYQDSKWVAEQVLEELSSRCGLSVTIHRPASIIGAGAPKLDLMAAILQTSRALGKVPMLQDKLEGSLDLVPVEHVSGRVVDIALDSAKAVYSKEEPTVKFVHHCNDKKLPPGQLKVYLEEESNVETTYELVGLDEWMNSAAQAGMDPVVHEFLSASFADENKVRMPLLA